MLICSVGTEVFYRDPDTGVFFEDSGWSRSLDAGGRWRREEAERAAAGSVPELKLQRASEQRPHKLSFHSPAGEAGRRAVDALRAALDARGMTEDVAKVVYSGGTDVDVLAAGAGKGRALEAVREEARRAVLATALAAGGDGASSSSFLPAGLQVNGDSGNDAELFEVEGARGCVVANAHEELRAWYEAWRARGGEQAAGGGGGGEGGGGDKSVAAAHAAALPRVHLASEPCSGGVLEVLGRFGTADAVARLEDAEAGDAARAEELRAARRLVVAGLSSAAAARAPTGGATALLADGREVPLRAWAEGAAAAAAADAARQQEHQWVDRLRTRHVADGCVLATFETWSGGGGEGGGGGSQSASAAPAWRRRPAVRLTTALLRRRRTEGTESGCEMEVVHVREGAIEPGATATERLAALVSGGE